MSRLATCAGFRSDLLAAIRQCGVGVELGDHVPFTERFGDGDRGLVAVVVATAVRRRGGAPLAVDEMFDDECLHGGGTVEARPLSRAAVATLATFDDLSLPALWREVWGMLGRPGAMPADLEQAIRGLVVHCRAAVANGWEVLVVEGT